MSSPVATERKGYRRGLILGLTMAESMLLLVFCLLLVAAAMISDQKKTSERLLEEKNRLVQTLTEEKLKLVADIKRLEEENKNLLLRGDASKVTADEWHKLRWAREIIAQYRSPGGDERSLENIVDDVKTLATLRAEGVPTEKISELASELKTLVALRNAGLTADEFAKLAPSLKVLKDKGLLEPETTATTRKISQTVDLGLNAPANVKPHEWPPIINLTSTDKFFFDTGRAVMSDNLRNELTGPITTQIAGILQQYDVDLVEVIGHTDEQPIAGTPSNLDRTLSSVLNNGAAVDILKPGDNAGLGLARAVAVTQILQAQDQLKNVTVLPYSAAQLIVPGDRMTVWKSGNDESRRRIEIRVRKREVPAKT